jgi:hypothetical protein
MSVVSVRGALAVLLAGLFLMIGAAPAQADPAPLSQVTITFPDGRETVTGGTIAVRFDAGGDSRVTGFRYSLGSWPLSGTVEADVPGGSATVSLSVGSIAGDRQVFAAAVDNDGLVGPLNQATINVTQTVQFRGRVLLPSWLPAEGATVTLEPGGYRQTSDESGEVEFRGIPAGEYTATATATLNGNCPVAAGQLLWISKYGTSFEFHLRPVNGEPCPPDEVEVPPATLGGVVQGAEGEITVTLEPGGLRTTTNEFGWYEFPALQAGTYTVTAAADGGDCGVTASGEAVLNGYDQTLDLYLQPVACP